MKHKRAKHNYNSAQLMYVAEYLEKERPRGKRDLELCDVEACAVSRSYSVGTLSTPRRHI